MSGGAAPRACVVVPFPRSAADAGDTVETVPCPDGPACPDGGRTVSPGLFAPARPVRLVDDVAGQLRDGIADGRLPYGTRLSPDGDLAAQFAVPPALLREALRQLRAEGLLGARTDEHGAIVFAVRATALRGR